MRTDLGQGPGSPSPRPVAFDEYIGGPNQGKSNGPSFRVLQVEAHCDPAPAQGTISAISISRFGLLGTAAQQHRRTKVGKHHPREGTGTEAAELQDAETLEWPTMLVLTYSGR